MSRVSPRIRSMPGARLKPTNLPGVYSFEPTPRDLNRRKAGVKTLKRHGLPVRPRGKGSETAAHIWDSMMSKSFRHIHPHLRVRSRFNAPSDAQNNWSGGVIKPPRRIQSPNIPRAKLVTVYSSWVIPTVRRPDGAADNESPWGSSAWVGLDGFGNNDVLQAGTAHYVSVADDWDNDDPDNVDYYAWYEWFPNAELAIENFPVAPGDAIFAYVRFEGPDAASAVNYGSARLVNRTTGIETSVLFDEPGATKTFTTGFEGISAECIMERPSHTLPDGTLALSNFVQYGEIAFTNFGACADDGSFFSAEDLTALGVASNLSIGEHSQDIVCRPGF